MRIWRCLTAILLCAADMRADDAPADANAAQNVPQPLLQRLLQRPPADGGTADNPRASGAKDYIDARAPRDLPLEALWTTARSALDAGDWKRGIDWTQKLLDIPGDALIRTGPDRWTSLRAAAQARLNAAPREIRIDYERQYGGLAQQLLLETRRNGSTERLVEVATRFLHTRAGADAANALATWHVDRQEFALAVRWFHELDASGAEIARDPRWRLKAALAARQAAPETVDAWLKPLGNAPVEIGGRSLSPRTALDDLPSMSNSVEPQIAEWRQAFGTSARTALVPPGEPLLQPEWSRPLSTHPVIEARVVELLRDLQDEALIPFLAAMPIAIGDYIAFRDLRGVRVVSAGTGQVLWDTARGLTPEQILLGQPQTNGDTARFPWPQGLDDSFFGEMAEFHPLTNLLFRDATVGHISSDGQRLFVLEDVAVLTRNQSGYQWDDSADTDDPFGMAWATNRLTAYDLATGRERWTIGGPAGDDPYAPPLAGSFFLGAPLAVGDELFAVATLGEEIRLWSLDAATGRPRWWQLLAYADTKIERDIARRWIGSPIAAGQGILVCPTTVGWVVAVDTARRSLMWAHRYLPPVEDPQSDPGLQFLPQRGLNDQWAVGSPMIVGQSVLFAPPDGQDLICLNLGDGALKWQHPRGEGLLVAGVAADRVLILEATGLQALSLGTGEVLWRCPWDSGRNPIGRGVVAGDRFILPMSDRELWSIDITSGDLKQRLRQPDGQPALGNLIKANGRWISLGPEGCIVFRERDDVKAELAARLQQDATDPDALLRGAEIDLLDRNFRGAEARLNRIRSRLDAVNEQRRRTVLWQVLSHRLHSDPDAGEAALNELSRLAATDEERFLVTAWSAKWHEHHGDAFRAFQVLYEAGRERQPEWVSSPDEPTVRVRRVAYLAGRMADLRTRASSDIRARIDDVIARAIDGVASGNEKPLQTFDESRQRLAELFAPQAASAKLWRQLANERIAARDWSGAEAILGRLCEHSDAAVSAESRLRLAHLWIRWGVGEDARPLLETLIARGGVLPDGRRVDEAARFLLGELPVDADDVAPPSRVAVSKWQSRQTPTTHAPPMQEILPPLGWPSWRRYSIQHEPQEQRVTFQSWSSDAWQWLAPLRTRGQGGDQQYAPSQFVDHRLWIVSHDTLHCLSPFERRIVWTRGLDPSFDAQSHRQAMRTTPPSLYGSSEQETGFETWDRWTNERGCLAVANRRYVCLVGRRELVVLDPLTGHDIWRKANVSPQAAVFGGTDVLYVFQQHRDPPIAEAYRAADGQPLSIPNLADRLSHALTIRGNDLVLLEARRPFGLPFIMPIPTLRRWNPLTGRDAWKLDLPAGSVAGMAGDEMAIVLLPKSEGAPNSPRKLEWIDLENGTRHPLAPVTLVASTSSFVPLVDDDHIYLVANNESGVAYHHYGDSLPSIPAHGRVAAWDRRTGQLLWHRDVADQHLVLDRFTHSPVLLFLSRSWKQQANSSFTQLSLLALHKPTGQVLYESTAPSAFSGFHGLVIRPAVPSIELQSYNLKLRLSPAE